MSIVVVMFGTRDRFSSANAPSVSLIKWALLGGMLASVSNVGSGEFSVDSEKAAGSIGHAEMASAGLFSNMKHSHI